MLVIDPNIIAEQSSGLASVTSKSNNEVVIQLKNSSTLTINSFINDDGEIEMSFNFLNGKMQKTIDKKQELVKKLQNEINEILNESIHDDEDHEDQEDLEQE